ncbi:MAG TPA: preprotein translocase subunit SecG [Coxiellaceae bacterium]|nr:MAG: preprotein translocase subunit SecG [Gammaproteobacteria bacterium RIFCSPHIGHO2_12_FULL_36_30]HLB56627.1 preprotein translocase subunit SecG [Coxiellaceae bacterium]
MQAIILIFHVIIAVMIVALVLMQHGRGADVGASFGSGSSNTMFGSAGAMPFLMKLTVTCAALFFLTSISLSYLAARGEHKAEILNMPAMPTVPATTAPTKTPNSNNDAGFSFTPTVPNKK